MIARIEVPIVVIGDPAYSLLPWIMKPYIDTGNLTCEQRQFNYQLIRARVVVDDAFGRQLICPLKKELHRHAGPSGAGYSMLCSSQHM